MTARAALPTIRTRWTVLVAAVAAVAVAVLVVGVVRHGPRTADAATEPTTDTVTVVGVGTADGRPDTLSADFRVHVTRPTVQTALDAQAAATRRLLAALEKAGVAHRSIKTVDLSINRHYDNHGNVTGYDADESIRARITPLSEAGRTISAGATASGNDVEVGSIAFDIADDTALVTSARANAFADARARAEQYADLADRTLGRVEKVTETVRAPQPTRFYGRYAAPAASGALDAASVPVRGGRQTLTVRVAVVFALP
jgi:uncharacterized protein YggE